MDRDPVRDSVEVDILQCRRAGSQSGTGRARSGLDAWRSYGATPRPVQGFGDAAYRVGGHDETTFDSLAVRKANVVVIVTYMGSAPYATAVTADDELTRDALRQIRLS